MPTVPQDQNRVAIQPLPNARSNVNYSPEAFGAGIGRGLQQVGGVLGDYAQQEQQKQDTAALMSAERRMQEWQNNALFAPQTGAFAQRGKDAFGLPDRLLPEWDKLSGEVEQGLTENQKQVFRERAGNMRMSMQRDLMRHAGSEAESFQKQETSALVTTRMDTALLYWSDPARFDKELREAQGVFLAGNPGIPPAAAKLGLQEIESKGRAGVVQKMLVDDPLAAQRYYDTYRETMTEADRAQSERLLKPAREDAEADEWIKSKATGGVRPDASAGSAITAAAAELGIDPVDLATVISYETGGTFDPDQGGPTTRYGRHMGLIQFGEPQRLKYGVRKGMTFAEQMPAVVAYLRDAGVKPGMGLMDVYSAINAGAPGRYNASDEAAGGAPGTVRDKVTTQMDGHRRKALALVGGSTGIHAGKGGEDATGEAAPVEDVPFTPMSTADMLKAAADIPDSTMRRNVTAKLVAKIQAEKAVEAERDEAMTESINTKVEAATPGAPLRQVLSPEEYAWAAENGKLPAWEARMTQRVSGLEAKTDPTVFDALQTVLTKAEQGDATALEQVRKLDVTTLFTKLDPQARDYVTNRRSSLLAALDKAKAKDAPDFASEDELLNVEVFDKLGISKSAQKDEPDGDKVKRFQFMQMYWASIDAKQQELGRKVNSTERQQIMRDLLLPFSRKVRDTGLMSSINPFDDDQVDEAARNFEIGEVPVIDRRKIAEAYQHVYGVAPTSEQIRAEYLRAKGYKPQVENN